MEKSSIQILSLINPLCLFLFYWQFLASSCRLIFETQIIIYTMKFFVFALFFGSAVWCSGQTIVDQELTVPRVKSLSEFITSVEKNYPVKFYYLPQWIESVRLENEFQSNTIGAALNEFVLGTDLFFRVFDNVSIVIAKDPSQMIKRIDIIGTAKLEQKKINHQVIGSEHGTNRKSQVKLRGQVRDGKNNDPLAGASIYVNDMEVGKTTDGQGRYEIDLPSGLHVITFSYLNYEEKLVDLEIYEDRELQVKLIESPILLSEVIVTDKSYRDVTTSGIGQMQFMVAEIKKKPTILGEVDIIRQIQQMPGVSTVGEAATGFNVRGGSVDQNLILYDGVPILNSSHAFGFFGAFNADAVRDVTFYRGGIPPQYGGRASSVLDINTQDGDYQKWKVNGGIGMLASNLTVSGPINKDKTSISFSGRTTYSDWLVHSIRTNYADLKNSKVFFYDGTAKLSHKFNDRSKLSFTWYSSQDQFSLGGDSTYGWHNQVASLKFDHVFSSKLHGAFTVGQGAYGYQVTDKNLFSGFKLQYSLTFPTALANFNWQNGIHKISFGVQSTYYAFMPGNLAPNSSLSNVQPINIDQQKSLESGIFLGDGISLDPQNYLEAGLRVSMFNSIGPGQINTYQPGLPLETYNQTGTAQVKGIYKTYHGVEPRLSLRHSFSETASIKAGYNRIYQYMQLVSNTAAITPVDIWQPSNNFFKPQQADQVSVGYYRSYKNHLFEAFIEGFYKEIANVLDFKDGAQLILNNHLETDLLQGKSRMYGIEFSITKTAGRFSGTLNYTYSRSLRTFASPISDQNINGGKEYRSNYDIPNNLNISWKYDINRRLSFTGNFTYRTGRPISYPLRSYMVDNVPVLDFSNRNQFRIPDYHRLDIAFVLAGNHKRHKIWGGNWALSFYNVYGRKNPYSVFFQNTGNTQYNGFSSSGTFHAYKLSIIGTILPSLMYSFKF